MTDITKLIKDSKVEIIEVNCSMVYIIYSKPISKSEQEYIETNYKDIGAIFINDQCVVLRLCSEN